MRMLSKSMAIGLLIVGLILITIIASLIPGQIDFTNDNLYTISPGSKDLLAKIEEPIRLEFYFSRGSESVPIIFKNFGTRVEELLKQYVRAGEGMIELKVVDPEPDTKDEEAAVRAGLTGQRLPTGESFFFGLAVILADQQETIPVFNIQREPFLEYDISRLIYRVQQFDLPKLGIISSLPLIPGIQPQMMAPNQRPPQEWVLVQELRRSFQIEQLSEGDATLVEEQDLLAIIHPQNLGDEILFAIDQFVLSGKPVLIAVDPSSVLQKRQQGQQQAMMGMGGPPTSSDLPQLFANWGIVYEPINIVADLEYATMVGNPRGGTPINYPAWLTIDSLNEDSPPSAPLKNVFFAESGSFRVEDETNLELTTLVASSPRSDTISASMLAYTSPEDLTRQISPTKGEYAIAGILRGKLQTAFPDGKPEEEDDEEEADEEAEEKQDFNPEDEPTWKMESLGNCTIALIADTDFLADEFSVEKLNFLGFTQIRPRNDNLSLVSNLLEFLSGSEDLLSLRGKGNALRPFKVIKEIEVRAQQKYQEQLATLEEKISDVQRKLRELQEKQRDRGKLVAGPELRKAVEDYRVQEAEMRGQRREIRKKLREDIKSLETSLALANLLVVPIVIGVIGVNFFVMRHKRQRVD